jgi:hypothetical protein
MSFHTDLSERLASLCDKHSPEDDPAIWAVRACGVIALIIGDEDTELPDDVRNALEAVYVLTPDKIIAATAMMSDLINKGEIE